MLQVRINESTVPLCVGVEFTPGKFHLFDVDFLEFFRVIFTACFMFFGGHAAPLFLRHALCCGDFCTQPLYIVSVERMFGMVDNCIKGVMKWLKPLKAEALTVLLLLVAT